jgi:hypothetical protein
MKNVKNISHNFPRTNNDIKGHKLSCGQTSFTQTFRGNNFHLTEANTLKSVEALKFWSCNLLAVIMDSAVANT